MNHQLFLFVAVFFLLLSWFNSFRHYLRTWIAQFRSQPSIAKRRRKNKSHNGLLILHNPNGVGKEHFNQWKRGTLLDKGNEVIYILRNVLSVEMFYAENLLSINI